MSTVQVGDVFSMEDENGQEVEIEVLGLVTVEEVNYAAVAFSEDVQDDSKEDIDVFFLRVESEEELYEIEEDAEFERVSKAFQDLQEQAAEDLN
ncbi:DUF1292 domain-containing protein [Chryseomicrobium aureum]|uniref:DUF1292 domain-containing protein n=1 Tax=Chryseomicrobium aureum TaxID=1441723 RepID=UPI0019595B9F|nr:DUF1292 domain-containing protein [Chryseomicrobium aureum]MBM7707443.1 uncharacterized protein YrzB (UPF0473 family) [Chryseomicrobium aureum]